MCNHNLCGRRSRYGACGCASPCGNGNVISGFNVGCGCPCGGGAEPAAPTAELAYAQFTGCECAAMCGDINLITVLENSRGFITANGGSIVLAPGAYLVSYGLSAELQAGGAITVTPVVDSALQAQYAAAFSANSSAVGGACRTFIVSGSSSMLLSFSADVAGALKLANASFSVSVVKIG